MRSLQYLGKNIPGYTLRATSLAVILALSACGGDDNDDSDADNGGEQPAYVIPAAPAGLGRVDTAPVPDVSAFVDFANTNQRGDPRYATLESNAGVRVLSGFLDIWEPRTRLVDAGVNVAGADGFPGIIASDWTGVPGDATDGRVKNKAVHDENIAFVVRTTANRTAEQATAAYLDDRRGKNYSVTDGLGPLTAAWRSAAQQTTTINDVAPDATTVKYDDAGNNTGVSGAANPAFGDAIAFVQSMGANASTEPGKRFYKYARPWRWSSSVQVLPTLEPAKSLTAATDGGYPSGHTAESVRNAIGMAYLVPERFQELLGRGVELGESRIIAGMHSPLDVMSGRILGQASAAGNIYAASEGVRSVAYAQARQTLMAAVGASTPEQFLAFAHSQDVSQDRFADHAVNKSEYRRRLTFSFTQIGDTGKPAVVPKGAEVMLETRLPYLTNEQRRVVLKSTALPSGYPVLDDAEGFGRLNLFDAADGYGAFNGDVEVTMNATLGGFNALDVWRNNINGAGKLTKSGTGTLGLAGANAYTGGTVVAAGILRADSAKALGDGAVYVSGGTLDLNAVEAVQVLGTYTQTSSGTLLARIGDDDAGQITVNTDAALGGQLNVEFRSGYAPQVGSTITVLRAAKVHGQFAGITVKGFKATAIYNGDSVQVRLDAVS
ncbi:acid phosphatase [Achromobacter arsenitoxydans]|uniref:Autotransporter-associated beta strand repeat protein n=1 Tax=Achromobacter arsenitoxydans SY8 TaxID=477184 RepID=H0FCB7_9BURK|nr:phosphatase PAP2 family protein [Achromobacter arsenitoxydans]EHK64086.1 autotransporter-associated beta strand repeat protein [Achromobacter arsenitoxydans SY8]